MQDVGWTKTAMSCIHNYSIGVTVELGGPPRTAPWPVPSAADQTTDLVQLSLGSALATIHSPSPSGHQNPKDPLKGSPQLALMTAMGDFQMNKFGFASPFGR
jgi:hypothetical protein